MSLASLSSYNSTAPKAFLVDYIQAIHAHQVNKGYPYGCHSSHHHAEKDGFVHPILTQRLSSPNEERAGSLCHASHTESCLGDTGSPKTVKVERGLILVLFWVVLTRIDIYFGVVLTQIDIHAHVGAHTARERSPGTNVSVDVHTRQHDSEADVDAHQHDPGQDQDQPAFNRLWNNQYAVLMELDM
eukprot:scaffold6154_cov154-Amphora_coffeaeformis.AAC.3